MSKKFLGIKASGRIRSNTEIILKELLRPAKEMGHDIEIISLIKYNIKHCTGCFGCNNGELKCIIKDDLEIIKEKIANADAIALAAPCFAIGAPSIVKTVIDRSTAWALDLISNNSKPKYGAAIMVGGADDKWLSLLRTLPGEFLKIYNCHTVGMFTISNTGLRGEILLKPSEIAKVHELGKLLVDSIENDKLYQYNKSEVENRLVCPVCFSDTFHIDKNNHYSCAVCNTLLKKYVKLDKLLSTYNMNDHIFSPAGTREHNDFVGNKISQLMLASDEVKKRLHQYFDNGIIPVYDFNFIENDIKNKPEVSWDIEGLKEFNKVVPGAFKSFVKKAIEKKSQAKKIPVITKEVFNQIRKESGN